MIDTACCSPRHTYRQKSPELVANLQTAKLKTKLDQAVYYGDDPEVRTLTHAG